GGGGGGARRQPAREAQVRAPRHARPSQGRGHAAGPGLHRRARAVPAAALRRRPGGALFQPSRPRRRDLPRRGGLSAAGLVAMAARPIVVLTGAGISRESGLHTFRDADGIWASVRIEDVATPEAFARDP